MQPPQNLRALFQCRASVSREGAIGRGDRAPNSSARDDVLTVVGFRSKETSSDFPLDPGALALTLTGVFLIIVVSAFLVYSVPAAINGGDLSAVDPFALHKAVRMGFWGTVSIQCGRRIRREASRGYLG